MVLSENPSRRSHVDSCSNIESPYSRKKRVQEVVNNHESRITFDDYLSLYYDRRRLQKDLNEFYKFTSALNYYHVDDVHYNYEDLPLPGDVIKRAPVTIESNSVVSINKGHDQRLEQSSTLETHMRQQTYVKDLNKNPNLEHSHISLASKNSYAKSKVSMPSYHSHKGESEISMGELSDTSTDVSTESYLSTSVSIASISIMELKAKKRNLEKGLRKNRLSGRFPAFVKLT
jgi:hypothetical protein